VNPVPSAPPLPLTLALLADAPRWVAWQTENRMDIKGKLTPTKVPYAPDGGKAHADKPHTWGTRAAADRRAAKLPKPFGLGGVGIELGDIGERMLGGIDLDSCRDAAGTFQPWAAAVINRLASYTEVSPSGTGAKVFFTVASEAVTDLAPLLSSKLARQFKRKGDDHPEAIELYLSNRYFAVTDAHLDSTPAELRHVSPDTLRWVLDVAGPQLKGDAPKALPGVRQSSRKHTAPEPRQDTTALAIDASSAPPGLLERIEAKIATSRTLAKRWGGNWSGLRDESGSGRAFALAAALRKAGFTRDEQAAGARMHPDTREWVATKGEANGGRELARVLDHLEQNHLPPPAMWIERCQTNDRGEPIGNLASAMLAMRADPALSGALAYDLMQRTAYVVAPLPGDKPSPDHTLRPVADGDVTAVQEYLQLAGLPRLGRDTTHQAVDKRAAESSFHPICDYLDGLRWDGSKRLDTWLSDHLGAEQSPYTHGIGRMFLIAMVARVFKPGCKADYVPVFQGVQGARKSTACRILAGPWFSDNLPDLRGDQVRVSQHIRGKWLIELAELSAMNKVENADLKAFITRNEERFTPKFGRKEVLEERQCVFAGTTNKPVYLRDETGGRRFWPVKVGTIDTDALAHDRDQLFAEATAAFRAGEAWWPDADFEREHVAPEQEAAFEADAWEESISRYLSGLEPVRPTPPATERQKPDRPKCVTLLKVAREALFVETAKLGTADQRRIAAAMERLGWDRGARGGNGERFWCLSGSVNDSERDQKAA
jgi:hypothetical protein